LKRFGGVEERRDEVTSEVVLLPSPVALSVMKYSFASPWVLLALAGSALAGLEDAKFSVSALTISRRVLALADRHSRLADRPGFQEL
jgi:hypothetical protein